MVIASIHLHSSSSQKPR